MSDPAAQGWPYRQANREALSTIVYRSRAVHDMSPPALHDLAVSSEQRNRREALTGLMLYDSGQFFQWLEGPPASVGKVMASIVQDRRHTNIEILSNQVATARTFGDWGMKLATLNPSMNPWQADVIEPPPEIVQALRQRPHIAPAVLKRLVVPGATSATMHAADPTRDMKLAPSTAIALRTVILSIVIPQLCLTGGPFDSNALDLVRADARSQDLATLLVGSESDAALELMREVRGKRGQAGMLYAALLEPAARHLGDLWSDDTCSEFDLTLGLCRLQTAVRLLTVDQARSPQGDTPQPAVLIVPEPGELHRIGSALDNNILDGAGWEPQLEYPKDDRALQDLVSSAWFDVLDVSVSVALRRESWVQRVTETIAQARRASQNPNMMVVVGGRVFREEEDAFRKAGADIASRTSGNVTHSILRTINNVATHSRNVEASHEVMATPS
jgi:methanogenic corrinoid protein MtbC1